jgi:hypothetical protein
MRSITIILTIAALMGCGHFAYAPYPQGSGVVVCGSKVYTKVKRVQTKGSELILIMRNGALVTESTSCNTSGL